MTNPPDSLATEVTALRIILISLVAKQDHADDGETIQRLLRFARWHGTLDGAARYPDADTVTWHDASARAVELLEDIRERMPMANRN